MKELKRKLTAAADHVVVVGAVDWPTVVLCVVEVVPAIYRLVTGSERRAEICVFLCINMDNQRPLISPAGSRDAAGPPTSWEPWGGLDPLHDHAASVTATQPP